LRKHLWSRFLRLGIVLDYDNIEPRKCPMIAILVMEFIIAFLHFLLFLYPIHRVDRFENSIHKFIFPALAFLFLTWIEYDIEAQLLPLNKYCEDEPEIARQIMRNLQIIQEYKLVDTIRRRFRWHGGVSLEAMDGQDFQNISRFDGVLRSLASLSSRVQTPQTQADHLSTAQQTQRCIVGRYCEASEFWPTTIILSPAVTGEDTRCFRGWWYIYSLLAFSCAFSIIGLFTEDLLYSLGKLATSADGADTPRLLVDGAHILGVGWLIGIWSKGLLRLCSSTRRQPVGVGEMGP